jgi:hypothetical protein
MSPMKRGRDASTVRSMNDYTLTHPHPAFAMPRHERRPRRSRQFSFDTVDAGGMTLAERLRAHAAFAALWGGFLAAWLAA